MRTTPNGIEGCPTSSHNPRNSLPLAVPILTRRQFLVKSVKFSATVASLASVGGWVASPWVLGANERVRLAVCGLRKRGFDHVRLFSEIPNVSVAALCDRAYRQCLPGLAGFRHESGSERASRREPLSFRELHRGGPEPPAGGFACAPRGGACFLHAGAPGQCLLSFGPNAPFRSPDRAGDRRRRGQPPVA